MVAKQFDTDDSSDYLFLSVKQEQYSNPFS